MKIKGFLKYKTATKLIDFIIVISSFVISGILFTKLDMSEAPVYSIGVGFSVMLLIKYIKFNNE